MNWLKKVAQIILEGSQLVLGIGPILTAVRPDTASVVGKVESELQQLVTLIATVQTFGASLGIAGPDKARAAGPLVAQIFLKSEAMAGKQLADPAAFQRGATVVAGGIADMLLAVHENSVQSTPVVASPPTATP